MCSNDSRLLTTDALRSSYFDQPWDLFSEMIRLQAVRRNRVERALGFAERARARTLLESISTKVPRGRLSSRPSRPLSPPTPTRPEVIAWLDCVECDAELKKLRSLDNPDKQLVPELRIVLFNGPSKDRLDRQERHLEKTYRALKEYEKEHPKQRVPLSQSEYVQLYRQKYIQLNRSRAARALGAIATPLAKGALTEALKTNLPPELWREIELALKLGVQ